MPDSNQSQHVFFFFLNENTPAFISTRRQTDYSFPAPWQRGSKLFSLLNPSCSLNIRTCVLIFRFFFRVFFVCLQFGRTLAGFWRQRKEKKEGRERKKEKNKGPSDVKAPGCCQTQRTEGDILYTQTNNTQLMHYSPLETQEACKYTDQWDGDVTMQEKALTKRVTSLHLTNKQSNLSRCFFFFFFFKSILDQNDLCSAHVVTHIELRFSAR